jgi:hypothetical protein
MPLPIYKLSGGVQTQQSMESQHQIIKALQHTYITKIPGHREEHAKIKNKTK